MGLKDQTQLGVTFGQLIAVAMLLLAFLTVGGAILTNYSTINEKIADNTARIIYLERSRSEERLENKGEHIKINDKLDLLLIRNNNAEFVK